MDSFGMGGLASDMLSPLSAVSATPEAAVPASMVRSGELGLLTFRQVSHTVTEEATDLVERIVLVASVAKGVLLDHRRAFVGKLGRF
jgi:hypothetical protein